MATIQRLWDENGYKPGLKVAPIASFGKATFYCEIMDIKYNKAIGWTHHSTGIDSSEQLNLYVDADSSEWELYKEPPKTREVKLYAAIYSYLSQNGKTTFHISTELYRNETEAKNDWNDGSLKLIKLSDVIATVTETVDV